VLSKTQILALDDLPKKAVTVPEWGGSVFVRALTGGERDKLERMISKDDVSRASIVALCVVDDEGNRLFTENDIPALADKNGSALERIVSAALSFNMLTDESMEAGKDE
jgi:hypothetical protein